MASGASCFIHLELWTGTHMSSVQHHQQVRTWSGPSVRLCLLPLVLAGCSSMVAIAQALLQLVLAQQ
jgi:hypothetical protein